MPRSVALDDATLYRLHKVFYTFIPLVFVLCSCRRHTKKTLFRFILVSSLLFDGTQSISAFEQAGIWI